MSDGEEGGANGQVSVKNAEKDVSRYTKQYPTLSENGIYMLCQGTQN